ncbi:hypothetical protein [Promicromonospora sp. NPDC023805]|uniref:hypothetical protein n=1 Tax=Promicromonospora sp. NPDC023805 TaxID=3154696 RepID=UPI0034089064
MGLELHHRHEVSGVPDPLTRAMGVAFQTVETVGPERIEIVTLTRGRICLQPVDLNEGEQIAHVLGCDLPLDHRMFVPGHTLWAAERDGLEIQIRSVLRRLVAR